MLGAMLPLRQYPQLKHQILDNLLRLGLETQLSLNITNMSGKYSNKTLKNWALRTPLRLLCNDYKPLLRHRRNQFCLDLSKQISSLMIDLRSCCLPHSSTWVNLHRLCYLQLYAKHSRNCYNPHHILALCRFSNCSLIRRHRILCTFPPINLDQQSISSRILGLRKCMVYLKYKSTTHNRRL